MLTGRTVKRDKCGNTIGYEIKVAAYTLAFDIKGDLLGLTKMVNISFDSLA